MAPKGPKDCFQGRLQQLLVHDVSKRRVEKKHKARRAQQQETRKAHTAMRKPASITAMCCDFTVRASEKSEMYSAVCIVPVCDTLGCYKDSVS